MLLSLSWGLGKYYKERGKYGGKKYISSPLCATYSTFHCISTSPFPSPPPLSFLPIIRLLPFFSLCTLQLVVWTRNALTAFPQRAPISAALEENGARWRLQWRWSVGIFQKRLSHAAILKKPSSPSSFFPIQPSCLLLSLRATVVAGVAVGCEGGQKQLIGRQYFLVKMLQCDKAIVGREQPRFAAFWPLQSCGEGSPHRANRDSCRHMFLYGRSREKRTPKTVSHFEYFSEK